MINEITNIPGYYEKLIATVISSNKKTRELEVYIPKLMPRISENENYKSINLPTNAGVNIEGNPKIDNRITTKNSITVMAANIEEPIPTNGSKVCVYFYEGRIEYGFWEPFNIDVNSYDKIPDEKYPKLFTIKIGKQSVDIYQDDTLNIILPNNLEETYLKIDKTHKITIRNKE